MARLEDDFLALENALRTLFQAMKRPQHWTQVVARSGIDIDRPSATILRMLVTSTGMEQKCRVQDMAHHLGIEAPSITRKTQELARTGLIKRVPDPNDRRAIDLYVTAKGRKVADRIHRAQQDVVGQVLSPWSNNDRQEFIKLFERFSSDFASLVHSDTTNKKG